MSSYPVHPESMSRADYFMCVAWATACDEAMAGTGSWPQIYAPGDYVTFQTANPNAIHMAAGNAIVKLKNGQRVSQGEPAFDVSARAPPALDGMFREMMAAHRDMIHSIVPSPSAQSPPRSPIGMRATTGRTGQGGRRDENDRVPSRGPRSTRGRPNAHARPFETNAQRRERIRRDAWQQEIEAHETRQQAMEREITALRQRLATPPPLYAVAGAPPPPPPPPAANTPAAVEDDNYGDGDELMRDVAPAFVVPPRFPPGLPIPRAFTAPPVLPANDATHAQNGEEVFAYDLYAVQDAFPPNVRITPTEFQWTDLFDGTFANHLAGTLEDNALGLQEGLENMDISSPNGDEDVVMRFLSPEVLQGDVEGTTFV